MFTTENTSPLWQLLVLCVREQLKAEVAAANAARLARAVRVAARVRASSYPAVIARRTGLGDEEVWR